MSLATAVREAETYLEQEIEAQRQLLALVTAKEKAVVDNDTEKLLESSRELERQLSGGAARERIRREILEAFGAHFGVVAKTLTLSSIVERLGSHGTRIAQLREELRSVTSEVLRASRKLTSIAKYHQGIVNDVLELLSPEDGEGALVHVEA